MKLFKYLAALAVVAALIACEAAVAPPADVEPAPDVSATEQASGNRAAAHALQKSGVLKADVADGATISYDANQTYATVIVTKTGGMIAGVVYTIAVQKWSSIFDGWDLPWTIGAYYNSGNSGYCNRVEDGKCAVRLKEGRYRITTPSPRRLIAEFSVVAAHPEPVAEPAALLDGQRVGDAVSTMLAADSPAGDYVIEVGFSFGWWGHYPGMARHTVSFTFDPEGAPRYSDVECSGTVNDGNGACDIDIPRSRWDKPAKRVLFKVVEPAANHPETQWLCLLDIYGVNDKPRPADAYCSA